MSIESRTEDDLIREVYPQLRETARRLLRSEREGHTLQPTALVHETFLRLFGKIPNTANTPQTLLALAAHQMRHVLIDYARKHKSQKRGGDFSRVPLFDSLRTTDGEDIHALTGLNEALELLGRTDARALAVVELKFFAGFTNEETARILGISDGTVEANWHHARLWLLRELKATRPGSFIALSGNRSRT